MLNIWVCSVFAGPGKSVILKYMEDLEPAVKLIQFSGKKKAQERVILNASWLLSGGGFWLTTGWEWRGF